MTALRGMEVALGDGSYKPSRECELLALLVPYPT